MSLCRADALYAAGETISIASRLCGVDPSRVASTESSVMWYTEGKGDEDVGVHHFVRRVRGHWDALIAGPNQDDDWRMEDRVDCRLPPTPLSYRGFLITIRWCVRWRVQLDNADDIFTEIPFHLVAPEQVNRFRSPGGDTLSSDR